MELFKEFARGQENAQDQLNDNFRKLETPYEILFDGSININSGTAAMSQSIKNFSLIQVTLSSSGNRVTANYKNTTEAFAGRMPCFNITDASTSKDWQFYETVFEFAGDKVSVTSCKRIDQAGGIVNNSDGVAVTNVVGWY